MSRASLSRETRDVWKWYRNFFKEVIRLENAEVFSDGKRENCEPRCVGSGLYLPDELSVVGGFITLKVNAVEEQNVYRF